VVVAVERKMSKQAHQVIGHHDEAKRGFIAPEILQTKSLQPKVLLEFLDAVFAVRPADVNVPDLIQRQVQFGHIQAEAIIRQIFKEQLARCLRAKTSEACHYIPWIASPSG